MTHTGPDSSGHDRARVIPVLLPATGADPAGSCRMVVGRGPAVLRELAVGSGAGGERILADIANRLLVRKGTDWTVPILGEYLEVWPASRATFALAVEDLSGELLAHGAIFQSAVHPETALLAHIRTAAGWQRRGLAGRITRELKQAAAGQGARHVILATDDKLNRAGEGERAAPRLYGRLGFGVLAEKTMADTRDWLMVARLSGPSQVGEDSEALDTPAMSAAEIEALRHAFHGDAVEELRIEPVEEGDLAGLFLLLNLSPPDDFRIRLWSWGVLQGPELERAWVVNIRPALADRDRLGAAGSVLRAADGRVVAVAAARPAGISDPEVMEFDFYCLPAFLRNRRREVQDLVTALVERVRNSGRRPTVGRFRFTGADPEKADVFRVAGWVDTGKTREIPDPASGAPLRLEVFDLLFNPDGIRQERAP